MPTEWLKFEVRSGKCVPKNPPTPPRKDCFVEPSETSLFGSLCGDKGEHFYSDSSVFRNETGGGRGHNTVLNLVDD